MRTGGSGAGAPRSLSSKVYFGTEKLPSRWKSAGRANRRSRQKARLVPLTGGAVARNGRAGSRAQTNQSDTFGAFLDGNAELEAVLCGPAAAIRRPPARPMRVGSDFSARASRFVSIVKLLPVPFRNAGLFVAAAGRLVATFARPTSLSCGPGKSGPLSGLSRTRSPCDR